MPAFSPPPDERKYESRSVMSTPKTNLLSPPSRVDARFLTPLVRGSPGIRPNKDNGLQAAQNIHPRHGSLPASPYSWKQTPPHESKPDSRKAPPDSASCQYANSLVIFLIATLCAFLVLVPDKDVSKSDWTQRWNFSAVPAVHRSLSSIEAAEAKVGMEGITQDESPAFTVGSRIVAIGDIHGDYPQSLRALALAGLVDEAGHWVGLNTVLVQTGDLVDRGDDSVAVVALFERLKAEALQAGGDVVNLLGNHELMNLQGDFRYLTKRELEGIAEDEKLPDSVKASRDHPSSIRLRAATTYAKGLQRWKNMLLPSQPLGRIMRGRRTAVILGDGECRSLFVHAGILPGVLAQQGIRRPAVGEKLLKSLNLAMSELLSDCDSEGCAVPPGASADAKLMGDDSPVWYRGYAVGTERMVCDRVKAILQTVSAKRMVIGHTIQEDARINGRCNGLIHLIDVGISRAYLGGMAAWECTEQDGPMALYEDGRAPISPHRA